MIHALLIGIAGSLHCVGMCGPLMMALPLSRREKVNVWMTTLLYQLGRITTYALIGLCFGLLGQGLALAGVQKVFSLFSGALLLAIALSWFSLELRYEVAFFKRISAWVQRKSRVFLHKNGLWATWTLGMLNGLIPCGLVYVAAASAITVTHSALEGAFYMFSFGLGTLPALLGLLFFNQKAKGSFLKKVRILQPILLLIAGALLLMRGFNLDISLFESAVPPAEFECH